MLPLLMVPPPVAIACAGLAVAPYMITLYAITDRLAPPHQATVAMTVLCAGGPLGTAAGRAVAVAARWSCDVG